jgi:hypothetical protein
MTPAEAQRLSGELSLAFGRIGMQAGVSAPARGTHLTAETWSGGIRWDHAWVTASYSDLYHLFRTIHSQADLIAYVATGACAVLSDGVGLRVCLVLGGGIVALADHAGNFANVGNHGVWAQYYWVPGYHSPGGYW